MTADAATPTPNRTCTCDRVHIGKPWGTEHGNTCWPCWSFHHVREHNLSQGGDGNVHEWLAEIRRPVQFDPPPPVACSPKSPRAVVTVAAGPKGEQILEISEPSLRAYAARCGADLVVLRPPLNPRFPLAAKWHVAPVFDHYERIAFIDADILIPPSAGNIFDEVPRGKFGIFDELHFVLRGWPGLIAGYQRFREGQGLGRAFVPWYLNSGVYVAERQHRAALATPVKPCHVDHCVEQHQLNAMLDTLGVPVHLLAEKWNFQWWPRQSFDGAPPDAMLHFSAIFDHGERLERMKAVAAKLAS